MLFFDFNSRFLQSRMMKLFLHGTGVPLQVQGCWHLRQRCLIALVMFGSSSLTDKDHRTR